jgi:hypothetical protein
MADHQVDVLGRDRQLDHPDQAVSGATDATRTAAWLTWPQLEIRSGTVSGARCGLRVGSAVHMHLFGTLSGRVPVPPPRTSCRPHLAGSGSDRGLSADDGWAWRSRDPISAEALPRRAPRPVWRIPCFRAVPSVSARSSTAASAKMSVARDGAAPRIRAGSKNSAEALDWSPVMVGPGRSNRLSPRPASLPPPEPAKRCLA